MAVEIDNYRFTNNFILQSQSDKVVVRRTGHARFRRGPSDQSTASTSSSSYDDKSVQIHFKFKLNLKTEPIISEECKSIISSSVAGEEATVSSGMLGLSIAGSDPVARIYSAAKPPLHRKKCGDVEKCKSKDSPSLSGNSSTGEEGPVSTGKQKGWLLSTRVLPDIKNYSSAKPPLPSSHRKRRREIEQISGERLRSHSCHCCKRSSRQRSS